MDSGSCDWFRLYILLTSGDRCDSSCMIFSLKTTCNNALVLNGATNFVLIFNHLISLNSQHVTFFVFSKANPKMISDMVNFVWTKVQTENLPGLVPEINQLQLCQIHGRPHQLFSKNCSGVQTLKEDLNGFRIFSNLFKT